MADYCATTRSNYFRVKDDEAFRAWCGERSLDVWTKGVEDSDDICFAISADRTWGSGWPSLEENADFCLISELAGHLDPRDIAVLLEIGSERLRYLVGTAVAVRADGTNVGLSLSDIYERAAQDLGTELLVTEAAF